MTIKYRPPAIPEIATPYSKKWFVVAQVNGRLYVDGGFNTEDEARQFGWKKLSGYVWDAVQADSANQALATQQMKHKVVEAGNVEAATKNAVHKIL